MVHVVVQVASSVMAHLARMTLINRSRPLASCQSVVSDPGLFGVLAKFKISRYLSRAPLRFSVPAFLAWARADARPRNQTVHCLNDLKAPPSAGLFIFRACPYLQLRLGSQRLLEVRYLVVQRGLINSVISRHREPAYARQCYKCIVS